MITDGSQSTNVEIATTDLLGSLNNIETKYAPKQLYYSGDKNLIKTTRVSVIGTRQPSEQGIKNTVIVAKFLVQHHITIVSGLAKGIDTVAHLSAINLGGKTIAVLGTPLNKPYPKENTSLLQKIASQHLALSQFSQGTPFQKKNFPIRNRTMALLSHASIIIEANENSGTLHQGWEALRLGRPLFIVEDVLKNTNLTWPNKMLDYGAMILSITDLNRIIEEIPGQVMQDLNTAF